MKTNLFLAAVFALSFLLQASPGQTPPGKKDGNLSAPSNLRASAVSSNQIHLSWTDNSSTETGFQIEELILKSNGGFRTGTTTSVGANRTSYDVTGLSPSTTYYYRIYAYSPNGNSPYSNDASATTPSSSPSLPAVTITAIHPTATESPVASGEFRITRSGSTSNALTVYFSVSGTATPNSDYYSIGTSATIYAGSASATISVTPINDTAVEGSETVIATLSSNAAYTVGSPNSATVTITSDDGASLPTVTITATDPTAAESPLSSGEFRITRSGSTSNALAVYFSVSGTATKNSDYYSIGTGVNIPAGSASATISVTPINDTAVESSETVIATLSSNAAYTVGSPNSATVTITSDDGASLPTVTITANDPTATEAGSMPGQFTVTRSGSVTNPLAAYFSVSGSATPGSDYFNIGTGVWMPAGSASATITVIPEDDTVVEDNETVIVALSSNPLYTVGSPGSATVTITSDDGASLPMVTITANDPTATEAGSTPGQFTIMRSGSTTSALTVNYAISGTATRGSDYANIGTSLLIPTGWVSATITVTPIDDTAVESDETVRLTLSSSAAYAIGSPSSATVTITSDDVSLPTVTTSSATGISATGATLNGIVNPNGSTTTARFQYGTTTSYGHTTASQAIGNGSSNISITQSISGITCNTTYHYRVFATNSAGTSYGSDRTFTTSSCQPETEGWSKRFGDVQHDASYAVATDSNGNIIVAGSFVGTADFGGGPLVSYNDSYSDIFVAKFSPAGTHLWSRSMGGCYEDAAYAVAVDENNNVVVTGAFADTADFGGGSLTSAGGYDIFVVKYSSSGAYIWAKRFGNNLTDMGNSIAVDSGNNILITGYFQDSIDFGDGRLFAYDSFPDAFVLKLSSSGAILWSEAFGGAYYDYGQGIAVDSNANVLVTGHFMDSIDLGGGRIFSRGGSDIFIAKYSPSGNYLWSRCVGGVDADIGYGVAVDNYGNIVVTGKFQNTADFGGGPLMSASVFGPDVFMAKYSASGGYLWSRALGAEYGVSNNVAIDGNGDIVLTGYFIGAASFGGQPISSAGGSMDIFVAKYSSSASYLWSGHFGGVSNDKGQSVAVDGNGNVVVGGLFRYTVDFGYGPLTANGYNEAFLVKFNP